MSKLQRFSRRAFMAVTLGASSVHLLRRPSAAAVMQGDTPLIWFDPSRADARDLARAIAQRGTATQAITGDCIRFAREQLTSAPPVLAGITGHADFILLSGCAAEVGYRLAKEYRYPAASGRGAPGALVFWMVTQRRPSANGASLRHQRLAR